MTTKSGNYWTCDGIDTPQFSDIPNAVLCKSVQFIERTAPNPTPEGWITLESYKDGQGLVKTYCSKKCLISDNR